MAYGKIKADAIIYDNSGSDVEKTVVSLTTPEGTAVKSTGESGTTKFLRVDGDGTCSWQVPPDTNTQLSTEAVQDLVGAMVTGNTETGITVTYEDGDGTLDFVVGTLNQDTTGTAAIATTVTVADESSDTTCFPLFVTAATGNLAPKSGTNITFNSSTGLLSATAVTTTGNVVVGGNLQVDGTTTTVNSSTMTVTDKNIEIAKGAANDAAADGAGITVDSGDGDKTWNWVDATDAWTSSEHIHLLDNKKLLVGTDSDLEIFHNGSHSLINDAGTGNIRLQVGGTTQFEVASTGVTVTGTVTDSKGDVRKIPSNAQSSAHVATAADAGKAIYISTGGVTLNNSVFAAGDAVTIINNSGSDQTITQGSGVTIHNAADASSGNRTLAGRGMATVWFASASVAYISGAGLS